MNFITIDKNLARLFIFGLLAASFLLSCSNEKQSAQKHFETAVLYMSEGNLGAAEIELRNTIQKDPTHYQAYLKLSQIYRELEKPEKELQALINATAINPDNMEVQYRLGQVFVLGRQTKKARETAQLILKKQPKNIRAMHLLATAQVQERNVEAAIKTLKKAIDIEPENPHLYLFLGFLSFYDKNDFEASESAYLKAISIDSSIDESYEELLTIYLETNRFDKAEKLLIDFTKTPGNRIQKFSKLARFYESLNRYDRAEKTYLKAIEESDKNEYLPLYNLGIFYARTEKYTSAVKYFNKALQIKDDPDIRSNLASAFFEIEAFEEASKQANIILKKEPNHSNARLVLSKLLIEKREYAKALESLAALISIDKNAVTAYYLKAVCLIQEDLEDLPAQEIRMAAAGKLSAGAWKRSMAIESLRQAIELSPDYIAARMLLADLYTKNNEFILADQQVSYVLQHSPDNFSALYMLGDLKILEKEWDAAEQIFKQIIDQSPDFSLPYVKLGVVYNSTQNEPKALEAFKKALSLEPLNMDALRHIVNTYMSNDQKELSENLLNAHLKHPDMSARAKGYIYFLLGKIAVSDQSIEQAKEYFHRSIQTYGMTTPSYEALARLSEMENNRPEAISYYELILSYDPKYIPGYMSLSRLYQLDHNYEKAKEYLRKVLELEDDLPNAANDLAYLLAEEGKDLQKALHLARIAESQAPNDPNVLDTLGWVYYKQKAYDLAIFKFLESIKINPNSPYPHLHLGWAYYDTGRFEKAREHMKIALNLNPDVKGGDKARSIIGE